MPSRTCRGSNLQRGPPAFELARQVHEIACFQHSTFSQIPPKIPPTWRDTPLFSPILNRARVYWSAKLVVAPAARQTLPRPRVVLRKSFAPARTFGLRAACGDRVFAASARHPRRSHSKTEGRLLWPLLPAQIADVKFRIRRKHALNARAHWHRPFKRSSRRTSSGRSSRSPAVLWSSAALWAWHGALDLAPLSPALGSSPTLSVAQAHIGRMASGS